MFLYYQVLDGQLKETLYHWPESEGQALEVKEVNEYDTDEVAYICGK